MPNPFHRKPPKKITKQRQNDLAGLAVVRRLWWESAEREGRIIICILCEEPIKYFSDLDSDHIEPGKMGGCKNHSEDNLQPAHRWCNSKKGSQRKPIGKICKRRPGRKMTNTEAEQYWLGKVCQCDLPKKSRESFCADCRLKVGEKTLSDLENADNREDYRTSLAQAELEILQYKPVSGSGQS